MGGQIVGEGRDRRGASLPSVAYYDTGLVDVHEQRDVVVAARRAAVSSIATRVTPERSARALARST